MEKNQKQIEEMNKEELKEFIQTCTEKKENGNVDIQKYTKRISNIKKMMNDVDKDLRLANSRLEVLELKELMNMSTQTENQN